MPRQAQPVQFITEISAKIEGSRTSVFPTSVAANDGDNENLSKLKREGSVRNFTLAEINNFTTLIS